MTLTPEEKARAMRARLAELTARFLERTGDEVVSMRASLVRMGQGDAAALGEIHHLAHRARGTGATLGLESLSERARQIELLAAARTAGSADDSVTLAEIDRAIEAMAAELGRLRRVSI
jgi:HPt (histidine-containing phosphotransfer) domain-containing protein